MVMKMKLKNVILLLSVICLVALYISSVSAAQSDANLTADDSVTQLETDSQNGNQIKENSAENEKLTANSDSAKQDKKTEKIEPGVLCGDYFPHKKSNYFKVKVYSLDDNDKYKYYKNVKLTVKVKIGKKTKVYNVKTNSKGDAKVFNVKNLKVGTYKVTVTTPDKNYKINEKDKIYIFGKNKKTTTVKFEKTKYGIENKKKIKKGDTIRIFYEKINAQYPKGVYAECFPTKNSLDGDAHNMIVKAKFFFKNKKTGKVVAKTAKLTKNKFYSWDYISVKAIKGYTPLKAKVTYLTR